jgi:hypothetical protein
MGTLDKMQKRRNKKAKQPIKIWPGALYRHIHL